MAPTCEPRAAKLRATGARAVIATATAGMGLLLAALPVLADNFGETRQYFKQWLGACRPDGYCSATAYVNPGSNGTVADYILRVGRHPEETFWEISLSTVAAMPDGQSPFSVAIDGTAAASFARPEGVAPYGAINDFYFLGNGAQPLLDRMVAGRRATFGFRLQDGTDGAADFSLAGLGAALIWIDTRQHRIGSERVAEAPPAGLFRPDVPGAAWMEPALRILQ